MIFNTEKKIFENYSNLNNNRIEPALFLINNKSLYVFDNINNLEKESFDFDKTFFLINQTEINIIFLAETWKKIIIMIIIKIMYSILMIILINFSDVDFF